ncbi:MAG: DUF4294 domain-containing protein [Bacteroidales bacterium]
MKKELRIITALFFILLITPCSLHSQNEKTLLIARARIINGDTIAFHNLPEVEIHSFMYPQSRRAKRKLNKLIRNIKIVYPYAKLAGMKLKEYSKELEVAKTAKEKKVILKKAEEEIQSKYGAQLKKMTFSQGKILIKLVDRETGDSSYDLVRSLKGKFVAFFWQTFARIFGYNLKIKYDPEGKDKEIETIVRLIEKGQL